MPRLGCMTRMSTFEEDETVTITPLRTFPVIRDLVTDVSFNYEKAREMPAFAPPAGRGPGRVPDAAGRRRALAGVPQVHRVLPLPEHLPRGARPRGEQGGVRRAAATSSAPPSSTCTRSTPRTTARSSRKSAAGPRLLQHHQVLHRGLPRAHQDHRQRDHPDEGARRRPPVRSAGGSDARSSAATSSPPRVPRRADACTPAR